MVLTFIGTLLERKLDLERQRQEILERVSDRKGIPLKLAPIFEEAQRERVQRIQQGLPVQGAQMGFFSSILGIGKKLIGGLLGVAPKAAKAVVKPAAKVARRVAPAVGVGVIGLGAGLALGPDGQPVGAAGGPGVGGNGLTFTRTIVQSVDARDGSILRQQVLQGAPHLMNRDLAIAKRVFRLAGKLHRRMPKRTVRASRTKQLTQQVVEQALQRAALPCPTPG